MTGACTRFLGNLDAEYHWARLAARGTGRQPRPLPAPVLERIALYATLLRVFAQDGDELWTPVPVDPACLRQVPGLPQVDLLSGRSARIPSNRRVIGWAVAPPWPLAPARLETAMRVNDRAFVLENGWGLPEAALMDSLEALDAARPAASAWVVKAPHSSAGRDRVVGPAGPLSDEARSAVARLLRAQGRLVVEPWRERTLDFGLWSDAGPHAPTTCTYHEQEVDARGRFRGILVPPPHMRAAGLSPDMQQRTYDVRVALESTGYEGPFGIDGWHYRREDGQVRTNLVGEINARLTFGRVAAALATRVAYPLWGSTDTVALRFGTLVEAGSQERRIPLLGSADGRATTAWLERMSASHTARPPDTPSA